MFVVIYLSSYFVKTYYLFMKLFVFYNEVRVKEAYLEAPRILQVAGRYQLVLQLNQVQRWSTSENPVHIYIYTYIYICRGWNRVWIIVLDLETHRSIFKKGMEIPPLGCGSGWLGAWDDGNAPFFPPSLGRYWGTILDNPVNIGQTQMEFI